MESDNSRAWSLPCRSNRWAGPRRHVLGLGRVSNVRLPIVCSNRRWCLSCTAGLPRILGRNGTRIETVSRDRGMVGLKLMPLERQARGEAAGRAALYAELLQVRLLLCSICVFRRLLLGKNHTEGIGRGEGGACSRVLSNNAPCRCSQAVLLVLFSGGSVRRKALPCHRTYSPLPPASDRGCQVGLSFIERYNEAGIYEISY